MRRCSFLVRTNTWDGDVNTGIRIYNSNVYRLNLLLKVMNVKISEGRDFREEDKAKRYGTFVFNERARTEYGLEIGSLIDSMEIVGFMPDVKFASFRTEVTPMAFFVWGTNNWGNQPNYAYIKVKAGSDLRGLCNMSRLRFNHLIRNTRLMSVSSMRY